jgi:GTP-binding protein
MAQTKARPPTFVLFATRAEQLPESYRRYLINSLRESFDLPGVPLRVSLRSTRNPFADGEEPAPRAPPRRPRISAPPETAAAPSAAKPEAKSKPQPLAKSRPSRTKTGNPGKPPKPKTKPGNPRGRTQKLARPGVKPKRASRPTSNKRTPR